MSTIQFRNAQPSRSCTKQYTSYRRYKDPLATDFNRRCGYTDCPDRWFGGKNTFHIDHFKPIKKHPDLASEYSNLVYACSHVNILKSDDDSTHYLDPCDVDYNQHFYRNRAGKIFPNPNSTQAKYMYKKLKLGLTRYQAIWLLEEIYNAMDQLDSSIKDILNDTPEKAERQRMIGEIFSDFNKYFKYLHD